MSGVLVDSVHCAKKKELKEFLVLFSQIWYKENLYLCKIYV